MLLKQLLILPIAELRQLDELDRRERLREPRKALEELRAIAKVSDQAWHTPDSRIPLGNEHRASINRFTEVYWKFFVALAECTQATEVTASLIRNLADRLLFCRIVFPEYPKELIDKYPSIKGNRYPHIPLTILLDWIEQGEWKKLNDALTLRPQPPSKPAISQQKMRRQVTQNQIPEPKPVTLFGNFIYTLNDIEELIDVAQSGGPNARKAVMRLCIVTWPMTFRILRMRRHVFEAWPEGLSDADWVRSCRPPYQIVDVILKCITQFDSTEDNIAAWIVRVVCRWVYYEPAYLVYVIDKVCTPVEVQALTLLYRNMSDENIADFVVKKPLINLQDMTVFISQSEREDPAESTPRQTKQAIDTFAGFQTAIARAKRKIETFLLEEAASIGLPIQRVSSRRRGSSPENRLIQYLDIPYLFPSYRRRASGKD